MPIITALLWKGGHVTEPRLAIVLAFGSVIGSGLQFAVQLPTVMGFLRPLTGKLTLRTEHVKTVTRNFLPVFVSRGVVQISAYVDSVLASYLPTGAVSALGYAQTLNSLPVSLFGMAISAAELPAMSSALGTHEEIGLVLRQRLENGLKNISFFVIPSAVAFLVLGDVVVATIYRSGHFGASDVTFVWSVLAGSSVGLLATTSGRLYSSAFYALRDTRTPLNFAIIRVVLTVALGYLFACHFPGCWALIAAGEWRGSRFRRNGWVGGICPPAPRIAGTDWCGGRISVPYCSAVGGGSDRRRRRVRGETGAAFPPR